MSPSKNGPAQADADRPPDQVMNRNRSERHCLARLKSRLLIRVPAMHIRSVEIENYKCFGTKTKLSFGPGINVILGAIAAESPRCLRSFLSISNQLHIEA